MVQNCYIILGALPIPDLTVFTLTLLLAMLGASLLPPPTFLPLSYHQWTRKGQVQARQSRTQPRLARRLPSHQCQPNTFLSKVANSTIGGPHGLSPNWNHMAAMCLHKAGNRHPATTLLLSACMAATTLSPPAAHMPSRQYHCVHIHLTC